MSEQNIDQLPKESLFNILLDLDYSSIKSARETNKSMYNVQNTNNFWSEKIKHDFPLYKLKSSENKFKKIANLANKVFWDNMIDYGFDLKEELDDGVELYAQRYPIDICSSVYELWFVPDVSIINSEQYENKYPEGTNYLYATRERQSSDRYMNIFESGRATPLKKTKEAVAIVRDYQAKEYIVTSNGIQVHCRKKYLKKCLKYGLVCDCYGKIKF